MLFRSVESRIAAGSVRTARNSRQPRQRRHRAARRDLPNRVVAKVRHIDVAGTVHRHATGIVESRIAARSVRAAVACVPSKCSEGVRRVIRLAESGQNHSQQQREQRGKNRSELCGRGCFHGVSCGRD